MSRTRGCRHSRWHVTVAALTLLAPICLALGRGALKLLCSLCGLAVGMIGAALIGLIGHLQLATVGAASWLTLPRPATAGLAFDLGLAPAFLAAGIAAALRTVGVVTTCQRINNAAWQRAGHIEHPKRRARRWTRQCYWRCARIAWHERAESRRHLRSNGCHEPVIAFAAALVLLIFGFSPKLSGLFLLIPQEVAGSLLVFTACFMISGACRSCFRARSIHVPFM